MKRRFRYGSVCSGIEAATTAWHTLGWKPVFFSEIEPFPCSVLAHHWPDVPNLGDMTKHKDWNNALEIDLLVGGTPCQAFSVAGLREGLNDPRGNLTLTFLGVVDQFKPRWVVWENVPGVLSDKTGAFGQFLEGLGQLGYGWAYRILDAQYFGVAQRRRRVFVVACAGADWQRAAAVLFEPDCLRGNPPPSRQAGQRPAGTISSRTTGGGGLGTDFDLAGGLQPVIPKRYCRETAPTINAAFGSKLGLDNQHIDSGAGLFISETAHSLRAEGFDADAALNAKGGSGRMDFESETFIATTLRARDGSKGVDSDCTDTLIPETVVTHSLRAEGFDASEDGTGRGTPLVPVSYAIQAGALKTNPNHGPDGVGVKEGVAYTLEARSEVQVVAFAQNQLGEVRTGDVAGTLNSNGNATGRNSPLAMHQMRVRRLTPRECERLQGFPDDHTLVPHRGKPAADGPRYKAIGNSMAVPVMAWIGKRIKNLENA